MFSEKRILIAVLLLGALLRFWGLGSAEIFHDEGFYAFRSIGYFDYLQNDDQTTPVQWFKDSALPWWTSLSFHDAPPLFFLVQNIFFRIFGDSLFVARLPSVLAGLGAIFLVYLLGKKLFQKELIGLLAALLLSVNHIHIWISRSSLLESLQIFLILLNIYYFFIFLENPKKWKMFGLILGLTFLAKYTSVFMVPIYLAYWVYRSYKANRTHWPNWSYLFGAFSLALLIFSPVLIYNYYLYQAVGHFDLQFAYLFGQNTPEWQSSLGKVQEPFSNLLENLSLMYSIPFLLLAIAGIGYAISRAKTPSIIFWLLNILFITLMLVAVGSAFRFIVLYSAPAVILIAFLVSDLYFKLRKPDTQLLFKILTIGFLAYESWFTIDGIFLTFPDQGVAKLDSYLEKAIGKERSKLPPQAINPHLDKIIKNFGKRIPPADQSLIIIYDENISLSAKLWPLTRRLYYHGILILTAGQFKSQLRDRGWDTFKDSRIYFVRATENTSLNTFFNTPDAAELERFLQEAQGLSPEIIIRGEDDLPMFYVYKFLL